VVIGGLTSVTGALIGAFALRGTEYAVGGGLQLVVTGTGVLLLLLVFPGGLGQVAVRLRQRALRAVAARRGLEVPALVADRRVDGAEGAEANRLEGPGLEELLTAASSRAGAAVAEASDGEDPETARLRAEAAELRARVDELERLAKGRR